MRSIILVVLIVTSLFLPHSVLATDDEIGLSIQMLPWEQVNDIIPKFSKFTVMDVETGKKFQVQRRAGSQHADVQPLTVEDTKIMKDIYDGDWSWRRKAIIVMHKGQWIAASMHGMPHGAGALKNNFPGHFCIHFYNSTTHRSNAMDLSHKLMVLKAAGKLEDYLSNTEPAELVNAFIAGLKQRDGDILSFISIEKMDWARYFPSVQNIKLTEVSEVKVEESDLSAELLVDIKWINVHSKNKRFKGKVDVFRFSPLDPWRMDSKRFLSDIGILKENKS